MLSRAPIGETASARMWREAGRSRLKGAMRTARRYPLGAAGAAWLLIALFIAVFASILAPYDPNETLSGARLVPPSADHFFGTDNLARDLFSRTLYGFQTSLKVALGSTVLAVGFGTVIGLVSGFFGSWTDNVIQRCVDIMLAFPGLILALTLVAMLGPSVPNVIIAISVGSSPTVIRVVRGVVLGTKEEDYVLSAHSMGATNTRILFRHILPNTMAPLIVVTSVLFGLAIVIEASLSFLGVGVQPPTATLGGMLSGQSRRFMFTAWWLAVFPGLAISTLVFAINLAGDSLRDALDPRLRGSA